MYSDNTQQTSGALTASDLNTVRLNAVNATFGLSGQNSVINFQEVGSLVFTGLTAANIVDWPLGNGGGTALQNIADTDTGVAVTGDLTANAMEIVNTAIAHTIRTDHINPDKAQMLRISGFDTVRVSDELMVLGTLNTAEECQFNDGFNALKESEIETCKIGSLDVENEDIDACPQTIHLNYGNPVSTTAFLKCYLGSTDDFLRMSLGHDGFFIGEGGLAFREDRKTRLFRSTKTFTHIGDVDEMVCYVGDEWIYTMTNDRAVFNAKVIAPNVNSSGSFTHCHVCEPEDQNVDWSSLTGRLMESTGVCAVRDDAGVLITDFKQAPGLSYAMPSVRVASTSCLGILLTVEEVADQAVTHDHGIELRHKVAEADGHKVLRVCGSGDCFVWTVKPLASEIVLTTEMLSGLYTKHENGIEQSEKVLLRCNDDYSFMMMSAAASHEGLFARVAQLETIIEELTQLS